MEIESYLHQCGVVDGTLSLKEQLHAATTFDLSFRQVEALALEMGILPLRYQRNQQTLSPEQQKRLFGSHVLIIGCGGLGGHAAEILTRIGIGRLSLYDYDSFEEHNLNRQNFSTIANLGREKATVVKEALAHINPATQIEASVERFDPMLQTEILQEADVVIDAVDDPQTKLALSQQCAKYRTHFAHAAIGGMYGQFSSDTTLEKLYPKEGRGAELHSGNPAFTVTLAASILAAETVKSILGIGQTLQGHFMVADLLENDFEILPL